MIARVEVQRGRYHDSVRLMQASKALHEVPGVTDALVAMATDLNLGLLADMGFDVAALAAGPNDLLLAVRAESEEVVVEARRVLQEALTPRPGPSTGLDAPPPRTIGSAARVADANLALISVPGAHAFVEAAEALEQGLHVMIFSDNVPLPEEVILKRLASERDLLVMGPDCGTAIIGGLGLGFANAVQPGPVGIVGASGTGIQQMCCLLDDAGVGITHALGTGSRDLSETVGGISTLQALAALDADPATELIVVISKPPAPGIAAAVRRAAAGCVTPVVESFMGETTIEDAVAVVLTELGLTPRAPAVWPASEIAHRPGTVRGVFSGGTLRDEARFVAAPVLGDIGTSERARGHRFVDYGDDEYTRGRAHPMIDQTVRLERLASLVGDATVGVVLMDVVLGYGAHADPAAELGPAVAALTSADVAVVVSLCGTRGDTQDRDAQAAALHAAGGSVWLSNAAAAVEAARLGAAGRSGERPR